MDNDLKFSVVLPVYVKEEATILNESINSLVNQTLLPNEIVIVKDGKLTNKLDEVIEKYIEQYPHIFKTLELEHVGKGLARNEGIKNCSYEYVALMDSDDISVNNRFEIQINYLKEHPDIDVLGAQYTEFENSPENIIAKKVMPLEHDDIYNFGKWRNPMNNVTLIFKKEKALEVGGFNHFDLGEDYYLCVKMLLAGMKFHNLPDFVVNVRAGERMLEKRVGLKIIIQEMQLFFEFYSMGYINLAQLIRNVSLKFMLRIIPGWLRKFIYMKFLRK